MRMRLTSTSLALSLLLAMPSLADDPPLDLAPLLPPKAPWLSKKTKEPAKPGGAKKKKSRKKAPSGVAAQDPGLELPPLVPLGPVAAPPAKPARAGGESATAAAPVIAAPPPVADAPPAPGSEPLPAPPLLKFSNRIGVLVQADASQAALETGLLAIAALAPLSQSPRLVPRPSIRCGDDACAFELGRAVDELVVASLQAGQLRLRVLDVATRLRVGDPQQALVKEDEAVAVAEALACKLLVPTGCTGELKLTASPGLRVEVDGAAIPPEGAPLPVGLHALVARGGARSIARTIAIVREAPLSLSLGDTPEPSRAAPAAVVAEAPSAVETPAPQGRSWNKPAGLAVAGVGVLAAGAGLYFGVSSQSDLSSAEAAYHSNGGAYRAGDAATLSSGNSSARKANLLFAASAVLAGAGALLFFAF
jgi:hypothetical protein